MRRALWRIVRLAVPAPHLVHQRIHLGFQFRDRHLLPRFFPNLEIARQRIHFQFLRGAHFSDGIEKLF